MGQHPWECAVGHTANIFQLWEVPGSTGPKAEQEQPGFRGPYLSRRFLALPEARVASWSAPSNAVRVLAWTYVYKGLDASELESWGGGSSVGELLPLAFWSSWTRWVPGLSHQACSWALKKGSLSRKGEGLLDVTAARGS